MKAKQLIRELQELVDKHGDLKVTMPAEWGNSEVCMVKPYDKDGNGPQNERFKGVKRFHIHLATTT